MPGTMFQLLRGSWVATDLSQKHLGEQTRIVSVEIRAFSRRLLDSNSADPSDHRIPFTQLASSFSGRRLKF